MTGVDETELAARAAEGSEEAFGELVAIHAPMARRVAYTILEDQEDADDAAQDGFLSAWQAIGRYDARRAFRPWLMQIVVNAARDLRRRRRVRAAEPLDHVAAAARDNPAGEVGALDLGEKLRAALATLPERQRLAVVLFDAEGYPQAEIAKMLGIPEGTVKSDVFHGRRALRKVLESVKEEWDE
ncbi:MAG: RNA polymerase sigma factor [Gemmatimonadales bacterium]|jgi:RNA polymerase sigma-70 factor (ECF subfamily)|nr:RNA polymerase sigma factor [Gemmatimonadales bacterium]MDZ4389631.1 RNA polymerase sigma factor [Gemmatimonadales bacterium]